MVQWVEHHPPPPVYWREDNLPRVRKVPHQVLGSQFLRYNFLQCLQAAGPVLPGLDMGKGLLPLVATPTSHDKKH